MNIVFLGTGAAEGVPAVFCNCDTCREIRRRGETEFHTRSQVLLDGELSVDFPPDAYYHSLRRGVDLCGLRYLLVTHSHMDHFYAHDFILRGYKYAAPIAAPLRIFGNEEVEKVFYECTRREMRPDVAENILMTVVRPFEPFSFGEEENDDSDCHSETDSPKCTLTNSYGKSGGGRYTAVALKAQHSKTETAYVYLIEKRNKFYLHLTDTGRLPVETLDFLENYLKGKGKTVDLVTFDCTFLFHTAGEISRHMGLEDNLAMKENFLKRNIVDERTAYVITHYSHNSAPLKETLLRAEKEYGLIAAFDGLSLTV